MTDLRLIASRAVEPRQTPSTRRTPVDASPVADGVSGAERSTSPSRGGSTPTSDEVGSESPPSVLPRSIATTPAAQRLRDIACPMDKAAITDLGAARAAVGETTWKHFVSVFAKKPGKESATQPRLVLLTPRHKDEGQPILKSPSLARGTYGKFSMVMYAEETNVYASKALPVTDLGAKPRGRGQNERSSAALVLEEWRTLGDCDASLRFNELLLREGRGKVLGISKLMDGDAWKSVGRGGASRGRLQPEPDMARHVGLQAARDLRKIEQGRCINFDVSLRNLLISSDGGAAVSDFGMVRRMDADGHARGCGTFGYMPPEVLFGEGALGAKVHTWSLGVCYAELATGARMFPMIYEAVYDSGRFRAPSEGEQRDKALDVMLDYAEWYDEHIFPFDHRQDFVRGNTPFDGFARRLLEPRAAVDTEASADLGWWMLKHALDWRVISRATVAEAMQALEAAPSAPASASRAQRHMARLTDDSQREAVKAVMRAQHRVLFGP